jgi:hypothetical protein
MFTLQDCIREDEILLVQLLDAWLEGVDVEVYVADILLFFLSCEDIQDLSDFLEEDWPLLPPDEEVSYVTP